MSSSTPPPRLRQPLTAVANPERLAAVAALSLRVPAPGERQDPDLEVIAHAAAIACSAMMGALVVVTPGTQAFLARSMAEPGPNETADLAGLSVPDELSFCAMVVATARPLVIGDATTHPVFAEHPLVRGGCVVASAGYPLVVSGVVIGALAVFDDAERSFTATELELLGYFAQLAGVLLQTRPTDLTDRLTGLPGRALTLDRLTMALGGLSRTSGRGVVVICINVDDFDPDVDDRAAGEGVLRAVADRMRTLLRRTDTCARIGPDAFVAICEVAGSTGASAVCERFVESFWTAFEVGGLEVAVDVSIGAAWTDAASTPAEALVRAAEAALRRSRSSPGSSARPVKVVG